jgi:hypothetical protein
MTKLRSAVKPTRTRGDRHDVTARRRYRATSTPPSTPPPSRRTDAVLRPATPTDVIVSRALDQELEWYFAYAESALHRESVGILPSYAAVRILATEPTDEACRARAHELARTVGRCLHGLRGCHASVLRSAYTPRRWPLAVERTFESVSAIVVRLAFAADPWPQRSGHHGLEEAVALRLSAALADPRRVPVAKLRSRAEGMLGRAIVAYAGARALEGGALAVA